MNVKKLWNHSPRMNEVSPDQKVGGLSPAQYDAEAPVAPRGPAVNTNRDEELSQKNDEALNGTKDPTVPLNSDVQVPNNQTTDPDQMEKNIPDAPGVGSEPVGQPGQGNQGQGPQRVDAPLPQAKAGTGATALQIALVSQGFIFPVTVNKKGGRNGTETMYKFSHQTGNIPGIQAIDHTKHYTLEQACDIFTNSIGNVDPQELTPLTASAA